MAEGSADNPFMKTVGPVIGGLIGAFLTWLTTGLPGWLTSALAALLASAGAVCGVVFSVMYQRYLGVLAAGGEPEGSEERKAYDRLRDSLVTENLAARLYARWLKKFLDKVDHFFGDAGMADRTLFPHAFGLQTPAPLWTAISFDRCLLLAFIYPIISIFLIWVVSGRAGPAEAALGFSDQLSEWRRWLAVVAIMASAYSSQLMANEDELPSFFWLAGTMVAAVACGGPGAFAVSIAFTAAVLAVPDAEFPVGAITVFATVALIVIISAMITFSPDVSTAAGNVVHVNVGATVSVDTITSIIVIAIAIAIPAAIFMIIIWLEETPNRVAWEDIFTITYFLIMVLSIFSIAAFLSLWSIWWPAGPLLLILGLLTLLNAPFDWASLGLTRALLRRGLERGGWWPFLYGLVDAALAAVIIAALALTMVLGVQAFDDLAAHGGGEAKRILPLVPFFAGIAKNPSAPEYWWVYALLFSTMIPSLLNLMIGGASLARGLPFVPRLLLPFMPIGKAVPTFERAWIALVLTLQSVGGAVLGLLVQFLLAYVMLVYLMPWVGLNLLDLARGLAALDLPSRIGQFFVGLL